MTKVPARSTAAAAGLLLVSAARAAERFPPPEFTETQHEFPQTTAPMTQLPFMAVVDILLLAAALAAAAYLTLRVRRRRWIFLLMLLCLGYFGFVRQGCVCPIGAIQNTALALCDGEYVLPLVVAAFFALPVLAALFFGRVFCGSVCPLGAIQDVVAWKPVRVPAWLAAALGLLPWTVLALAAAMAAVGAGFPICRWDPFVGFFRLGGPWRMLIIGAAVLALGVMVARPYCRFICPYGAILGLASRISFRNLRIAPDECVRCRLCADSCPFGALREPVHRGIYRRREGLGRLAILIGSLPVILGAGLGAGILLGGVIEHTHPVVALHDRIAAEEEHRREHREFQPTLETEAWRGPAATKRFNDRLDAFIESGNIPTGAAWPKDRQTAELLRDFLAADQRDREQLRLDLLARRAAIAGDATATAVTVALVFVAFVGWLRLLSLNVRRHSDDYTPDPSLCVSCGRCMESCPMEHRRRNQGAAR